MIHKTFFLVLFFLGITTFSIIAQSKANDISVAKLPASVKSVLEEYISILSNSNDLEECATNFLAVAGGTLVNDDGRSLRNTIKDFGLKKDFNNLRHYAKPTRITRVNVSSTNGTGYGESALKGKIYKIWIDKKSKDLGMPAPVSVILPEGHPTIKIPKVINIGSF